MIARANLPIQFHYLVEPFYFPDRIKTKEFLLGLFKLEKQKASSINYIFCNDPYLLEINKLYLKHDYYTDIITFPFSESGQPILADIYISIERVKENARLFNNHFIDEFHRVVFHGALHLCGYGDKTNDEVTIMRQKEAFYLKKYFVSRETKISRV